MARASAIRLSARKRGPARRNRCFAAIVLAVVGVAGLSIASAAQLDVDGGSVGAGTSIVASCQPAGDPIRVGFTSTFSAGAYRASAVTLSNVNGACAGQAYRIRALNSSGAGVGNEVTGTVPAGAGPFTITGSLGTAQLVTSIATVAVVIHG